jgi:HEAT repeat protein
VRAAALAAIAQLPEPGRQIAEMAGLGTSPVERERGAQRLRQIGTLPPLAAALRAVDHPGLRAAAARAVARLGEAGVVEALAGTLDDPEPAVRQEAAWMLGVTGQPAALAPLVTALAGAQDAELRATAARALGRLGDPGALDALTAAAGDADPAVAAAAARAITTLRGASVERARESPAILQVVVILQDTAPAERTAHAAALLDQLAPETLPAGEAIDIVTLAPGRPLLSPDEALLLVRRRFQTAPPGYHWEVLPPTDPAGRPALLLRLMADG